MATKKPVEKKRCEINIPLYLHKRVASKAKRECTSFSAAIAEIIKAFYKK